MNLRKSSLLAAVVAMLALPVFSCNAQSTPARALLALSKTGNTLSILDPLTLEIIARIPVSQDPHEVIASADGTRAYVCSYGGGSFHEINVIDLVAQEPLETIDTRPLYGPHDIVYVNDKVWFTAEGSKAIGRIDPVTNQVEWSMGTGQDRTHMIHVTPDGRNIYTTNITSGTVSILTDSLFTPGPNAPANARPRREWVHTIVPTANGSEGFDVSPDGKVLWTASGSDGTITIVDLKNKKSLENFKAEVFGANRLKFTPDGKHVFVSSIRTGELTIIHTETHAEVKRLSIGNGATGILMDPVDSRAFVASSADNYVAVVDLNTFEVVRQIDVGPVPDGLAWAVREE